MGKETKETPAAKKEGFLKQIWRTQKMATVERTPTTMAVHHDNPNKIKQ
jgi:hypothetical protein